MAQGKKAGPSTAAASSAWAVPRSIVHPEHHHTLNHLHHVSSFYSTLSAWGRQQPHLATHLERDLTSLAKKSVIRLDTSVKRAVCRQCNSPAIEGLTLITRNKISGPHDHIVQKSCAVCGSARRLPAPGKGKAKQNPLDPTPSSRRFPQRQRRKVGRIVKMILNDDNDSQPGVRPTRQQRTAARRQRLAGKVDNNTEPVSIARPQTQLPVLPPFGDRVKATGWDQDLLLSQSQDTATTDELVAFAFVEKAARSRGDHIILRGVGKNGAVGPST